LIALLDRLADRLARSREHLGRLRLQLGVGLRDVHAVGEEARRDEERAALDHEVERFVGRE
jgi:hypothetical protein